MAGRIPAAQVTTSKEAREEMLAWAGGHLSHQNEMMDVESDVDRRQQTLVAVAQADAAEAQRWAAIAASLAISEAAESVADDRRPPPLPREVVDAGVERETERREAYRRSLPWWAWWRRWRS